MRSIFECIINEHYVTCLNDNEMEIYLDQVWDILEKSYSYIGGLAGLSKDKIIEESDIWKLVRRGKNITAVQIYTTKRGGRKACYGGCDGTDQGKKDLAKIVQEDAKMSDRDVWTEVSDKALKFYLSNGHYPVPNTAAIEILKDKVFNELKPDGFFYVREIGGELHTKVLVSKTRGIEASDEVIAELLRLNRIYNG